MALSVSNVFNGVEGSQRVTVNNVTFDDSYLSGGETLPASSLGLSVVDYAICTVKAVGGTINVANCHYEPKANQATNLIHLFDETPAEVTSTNDVSGIVVQVKAYGH